MRNPINTQLPRMKKQVAGEAERKIWVAEGFISFLFFSFLFFIFFIFFLLCFRRHRVDYFHFLLFNFLDLDVIVLSRS